MSIRHQVIIFVTNFRHQHWCRQTELIDFSIFMIRSNAKQPQVKNGVTEQVKMIRLLIFIGTSTQHLPDFYSKINIQIFIIHFSINSRMSKNFQNVQKWIQNQLKCSAAVQKQTWMFSQTFVVSEQIHSCHQPELFWQIRIIVITQAWIHVTESLRTYIFKLTVLTLTVCWSRKKALTCTQCNRPVTDATDCCTVLTDLQFDQFTEVRLYSD